MAVNREYSKENNLIDCWDLLQYHGDKNTGITRGKTMLEDLKGKTALVTTLNPQSTICQGGCSGLTKPQAAQS